MTQPEIDAYVAANSLTPIDPADAGFVNAYEAAPAVESSPLGDISVVTLYGFKVGSDTICQQKYRDTAANRTECLRMLKDNVDEL